MCNRLLQGPARLILALSRKVHLCGHLGAGWHLESLTQLATIGGAIYGHPTGIADCISSGGRQGRDPSIVIACFVGAFSSHRRCDNLLHVSSGYPKTYGWEPTCDCIRPQPNPSRVRFRPLCGGRHNCPCRGSPRPQRHRHRTQSSLCRYGAQPDHRRWTTLCKDLQPSSPHHTLKMTNLPFDIFKAGRTPKTPILEFGISEFF